MFYQSVRGMQTCNVEKILLRYFSANGHEKKVFSLQKLLQTVITPFFVCHAQELALAWYQTIVHGTKETLT